jgi:hypothetical protein
VAHVGDVPDIGGRIVNGGGIANDVGIANDGGFAIDSKSQATSTCI